MLNSNFEEIKSEFKKYTNKDITKVDLNSTNVIKSKGVYELDSDSFFMLVPNFLNENKHHDLLEACSALSYDKLSTRCAHYIGPKYEYKGASHEQNDSWIPDLVRIKGELEYSFGFPINSLLLNKYESGDYIPFHQDNENSLRKYPIVLSLSLNEKVIKDKSNQTVEVTLYPGCLLVMAGKFNENYFHSVERPDTSKTRYNLTFRYVYPNSTTETVPSIDATAIQKDLSSIKSKLTELSHQFITRVPSAPITANDQTAENSQNLKVVLLKASPSSNELSSDSSTSDPDRNAVTEKTTNMLPDDKLDPNAAKELLNKYLGDTQRLSDSDIVEVDDFRDRNGPIVITFENIRTKVNILKHFKSLNDVIIRDFLSTTSIKLRKKALGLKKKGMISHVWVYRGNVYYSLPKSRAKYLANWDSLGSLNPPRVGSAVRR